MGVTFIKWIIIVGWVFGIFDAFYEFETILRHPLSKEWIEC